MSFRRTTLISTCAVLACMSLAASAGNARAPKAAAPAQAANVEWTVMVFMNGDNNLESFALEDFEEMAQVGSTDRVNVVVQMDRSPGFAYTEPDWENTLRFRVARGMKPLPSNALPGFSEETDMGSGAALTAFVRWARQTYPANRYMLVIWDHGQGWRVFDTEVLRGTPNAIFNSMRERKFNIAQAEALKADKVNGAVENDDDALAAIPLRRSVSNPVRSISNDDTNGSVLYNREVQDALTTAAGGGARLDVLGFDACLMGMVETGYAMRGAAQVMVGSEELEPGAGWNYTDWLGPLTTQPTMDAAELGRLLVDSYQRTYGPPRNVDGETTLSAIDLSRMEPLVAAVTAFANDLSAKLGPELQNIIQARQSCLSYAPRYGMHNIDLARFCDELASRTGDAQLKARAQAVRAAVNAAVLRNYAGIYRGDQFGSNGLAIYFPKTKSLYTTDPDRAGYLESNTSFPVEFVQKHRWDNFLHTYFTRVP